MNDKIHGWITNIIHKAKIDTEAKHKLLKGDLTLFDHPKELEGYKLKVNKGDRYAFDIKGKVIHITVKDLNLDSVSGGSMELSGTTVGSNGEIGLNLNELKAKSDDPNTAFTIVQQPDGSYMFSTTVTQKQLHAPGPRDWRYTSNFIIDDNKEYKPGGA